MALHHKIKPHYHVSIWIVSALLVLASVVIYNTTSISSIKAENGPSATTQKFFGFNGGGEDNQNFVMPDACQQTDQQAKMQALSAQMQSLADQMKTLSQQDISKMTPDELNQHNQQQKAVQDQMSSLQSQMNDLQKSLQSGPSDECKIAIVNQAIAQMKSFQTKMVAENKFLGTLDRVDSTVSKLESISNQLSSAKVTPATIAAINKDINIVKTDSSLLRNFFQKMQNSMNAWIANAQQNPLAAFTQMQQGKGFMDDSGASAAVGAADNMVAAFTDLVNILDKLTSS